MIVILDHSLTEYKFSLMFATRKRFTPALLLSSIKVIHYKHCWMDIICESSSITVIRLVACLSDTPCTNHCRVSSRTALIISKTFLLYFFLRQKGHKGLCTLFLFQSKEYDPRPFRAKARYASESESETICRNSFQPYNTHEPM